MRHVILTFAILTACGAPRQESDTTMPRAPAAKLPASDASASSVAVDTGARALTSEKAKTKQPPATTTKATKNAKTAATKEPVLRDSVISDRIKMVPIPESTKKKKP